MNSDLFWSIVDLFHHLRYVRITNDLNIIFLGTPYSLDVIYGDVIFFKLSREGKESIYNEENTIYRGYQIFLDQVLTDKEMPDEVKRIILFNMDLFS